MIPRTGAPLTEYLRLQFAEIERTWALDASRLDLFRDGLGRVLERIEAAVDRLGGQHRAILDPATMADLAEAERIVANASRARLLQIGESVSAGGARGGRNRDAPEWQAKAVTHARALLATGREAHEVSALCARKFNVTAKAARMVLQAAGVVPTRKREG